MSHFVDRFCLLTNVENPAARWQHAHAPPRHAVFDDAADGRAALVAHRPTLLIGAHISSWDAVKTEEDPVGFPRGSATQSDSQNTRVTMATAPDLPILTDVDHNEVTLSSLLAGRRVLVLILRHAF